MTPKLFRNHPNNFRTFPEPFHTSPELLPDHRNSFRIISLSPIKSYIIPEPSPGVVKTLSLLRYGSRTLQTWSRHSAHQ